MIALDLPGQGESDPLPDGDQSPSAHAGALAGALTSLGIDRFDCFGHNGGAAVAIELALRMHGRVRELVLDAPIALTTAERVSIAPRWLDGVLPTTACWDGGHLVRAWHMRRDAALWWPWFDRRRECIRASPASIDPQALTLELREAFKQPASFAPAWRAVIDYPLIERMRALARPPRLIATTGDLFAPCIPNLKAAGFPVKRYDGTIESRTAAIVATRA